MLILKVTNITGDTLTVERGADNTVARAAITGDVIQMRTNMQTLLDLSGGESTPKKRLYKDTFYISKKGQPIYATGGDIRTKNQRYADKLLLDWDTKWGGKLKVNIQDLTNNITYDELSFATLDDMATWSSINGSDTGGFADQVFVARVYEEVDPTIPAIESIYGLNRILAGARGKRRYTTGKANTANQCDNKVSAHLADAFNHLHGTAFDGTEANFKATCWLTTNYKRLYSFPAIATAGAYTVGNFSAGERYCFDGASIVAAPTTDFHIQSGGSGTNVCVLAISPDFSTNMILDPWERTDSMAIIEQAFRMGSTLAMIIGMESGSGDKSIVIKPIGVDQIVLPLFDFNQYELEVVYANDNSPTFPVVLSLNLNLTVFQFICVEYQDASLH